MLIFSDLSANLIIIGRFIKIKLGLVIVFLNRNVTHRPFKIFTGKYVEAFGLHKLIFVLL